MELARKEFGGISNMNVIAFHTFRSDVYQWRDSFASNPRTADEVFLKFRGFLKWCAKRGYIPLNPFEGVEYEALYKSNRAAQIYTQSIFEELIAASTPEFARLCRGVIHLGCRKEDIRNLNWSHIQENHTVYEPSKGRRFNRKAKIPHTPAFISLIDEIRALSLIHI